MILVDTHIVLWLAFEPEKLSINARSKLDEARQSANGLAISGVTLLELAVLATKGRFETHIGLNSFLENVESQFAVLPITGRACSRILELPQNYPKDPADRIIGATALVEGIPLITADRAIRRSKAIQTIW